MKKNKFLTYTSLTLILAVSCLACSSRVKNFVYSSKFYRIQIADSAPFIKYFSVDALGNSELENNTIQWKKSASSIDYKLYRISDSQLDIVQNGKRGSALWTFKFEEKMEKSTNDAKNKKRSGRD